VLGRVFSSLALKKKERKKKKKKKIFPKYTEKQREKKKQIREIFYIE